MIDFSELALSPNESRAARNFLGLSQAQTATQSNLPAHKLKRFETGNYVPDGQFLEDLREFYESEGFNFHDEDAPGAKAKARGDVFPAGVVGETDSFPLENQGKPMRPEKKSLQYMRITPQLESAQIDQIFDRIEDNEEALLAAASDEIEHGFLSDTPSAESQAKAVGLLRLLAENGLLYARLMGRELVQMPADIESSTVKPNTFGELLSLAMGDTQLATISGDKEAQARRKARPEPSEILEALIG